LLMLAYWASRSWTPSCYSFSANFPFQRSYHSTTVVSSKNPQVGEEFWERTKARDLPFDSSLPLSKDVRRPTHILLVRHGVSEANIDPSLHRRMSDHAIPLSSLGEQQSQETGRKIKEYYQHKFQSQTPPEDWYCRIWTSPYKRARQTAELIKEASGDWVTDVRENVLLAEQQFGLFEGTDWETEELEKEYPKELAYYRKAVEFGGRFWAKVPLGESRFDVCSRVYQSFGTLHRDAELHGIRNVIIVSHGVTLRAFLMMWLHLTPEWFEIEPNPKNCSIRVITENYLDGGYVWGGVDTSSRDILAGAKK